MLEACERRNISKIIALEYLLSVPGGFVAFSFSVLGLLYNNQVFELEVVAIHFHLCEGRLVCWANTLTSLFQELIVHRRRSLLYLMVNPFNAIETIRNYWQPVSYECLKSPGFFLVCTGGLLWSLSKTLLCGLADRVCLQRFCATTAMVAVVSSIRGIEMAFKGATQEFPRTWPEISTNQIYDAAPYSFSDASLKWSSWTLWSSPNPWGIRRHGQLTSFSFRRFSTHLCHPINLSLGISSSQLVKQVVLWSLMDCTSQIPRTVFPFSYLGCLSLQFKSLEWCSWHPTWCLKLNRWASCLLTS